MAGFTKKDAAELLMKAGLSSYMGVKIIEYIKNERAAHELNQKIKATRFVIEKIYQGTRDGHLTVPIATFQLVGVLLSF